MAAPILWTHDSLFPPTPNSASKARDFVRERLCEHDLLYLVTNVQIVVTDLVTNFIKHTMKPVVVTLEALPFGVHLTVGTGHQSPHVADASRTRHCLVELSSTEAHAAELDGVGESTWAIFPIRPMLMTAESDAIGEHPTAPPPRHPRSHGRRDTFAIPVSGPPKDGLPHVRWIRSPSNNRRTRRAGIPEHPR